MTRILIVAQGTYGDVFPMIALAQTLQDAGHQVTIAVEDNFLEIAKAQGLEAFVYIRGLYRAVRNLGQIKGMTPLLKTVAERTPAAYAELASWLEENPVDLVIRHFFDMAALVLVQEKEVPYINVFLSGASLFSRFDPPYSEEFKGVSTIARVPLLGKFLQKLSFWNMLGGPLKDYTDFSRRHGVVAQVSFGQISPYYNLLMSSKLLFPPQADWPENIAVTGYAFLDRPGLGEAESRRFAEMVSYTEQRPIILTLGSSELDDEVGVYRRAVQSLRVVYPGVPIVIVAHKRIMSELSFEDVMVFDRINYAEIFPEARLIIHQGGLGTTMEALRSGRPQVVVSRLADRPDNGKRVERLRCGMYEPDLTPAKLADTTALLEPEVLENCREAATHIQDTDWRTNVLTALSPYLSLESS